MKVPKLTVDALSHSSNEVKKVAEKEGWLKLLLATKNEDKLREMKLLLSGLRLQLITHREISSYPQVEETGETTQENALLKARALYKRTGYLTLADDTALEIDALGGAPGVRASRFAGPKASYEENRRKALRLLKGVPAERRGARFICSIALVGDGFEEVVEGRVEGVITSEERGRGRFGYDPIFFVPQYGKTFSQMDGELKNRISHRGRAVRLILPILRKLILDSQGAG